MIETTQDFYKYSTYKYRQTQTEISVDTIDLTSKSNISNLSVNADTYFYSIQLSNNIKTAPNWATLELNEFLLDGKRTLLNDSFLGKEIGWWSELSDSSGYFTTNPQLTIDFSSAHSSIGLTFYYDDFSYPLEYQVKWYYNSTLLDSGTFTGSSKTQIANKSVKGYNKIVLTITKAKPYAYIKLLEVDYGVRLDFTGEQLQGSKLKEEVSLMSNQLVSDSLEFNIINYNSAYDILNPIDITDYFSKGQKVDVRSGVLNLSSNEYEYIDMGKFYIDTATNQNGLLNIKCYGILNTLNEEDFYSPFYENATVETIASDILDGYSYYIHENIKDVELTGYIPIKSKKEALKTLLIAANGVVKEGRDGRLYIFKATEELSHNQIISGLTSYSSYPLAPFKVAGEMCLANSIEPIEDVLTVGRDTRTSQINVKKIGYYHKVEVVQKNYTKNGSSETLFDDDILTDSEGMAIIDFGTPVYDVVVPSSLTYSIYTFATCCVLVGAVNTTYNITITGKKYGITESTISATRTIDENVLSETRETMTIDSYNELIGNNAIASNCANWYLSQLKKRLDVEFNWWSVATVEASDWLKVVTSFNKAQILQTSIIEYDLNTLSAKVKGVI